MLAAAVFGISWAAPLIRLSAAPPLVIASWRLVIAEAVLLAALLVRGEHRAWRTLGAREHAVAAVSGVMLALHFWSWNASLAYTSIAASVVLVNTQPALVVLASALWLRERPTGAQLAGVALGMLGAVIVAAPAFAVAVAPQAAAVAPFGLSAPVFGDLLALAGAVTVAIYYLIGRSLRQQLALLPYVTLVYGWCMLSCLGIAAARGDALLPWPAREWALFAGLAAGPMLLGHTGMNWALGHLPAFVVNLTVLGEPVGAAVLAMLLPQIAETPSAYTVVGGAAILLGAVLALRAARPAAVSSGMAPETAPNAPTHR